MVGYLKQSKEYEYNIRRHRLEKRLSPRAKLRAYKYTVNFGYSDMVGATKSIATYKRIIATSNGVKSTESVE